MISKQETLNLSPFMAIYDIVVPKNNQLRQINGRNAGLLLVLFMAMMYVFYRRKDLRF